MEAAVNPDFRRSKISIMAIIKVSVISRKQTWLALEHLARVLEANRKPAEPAGRDRSAHKRVLIKEAKATGVVFDIKGASKPLELKVKLFLLPARSRRQPFYSCRVSVLATPCASTASPSNTNSPASAVICRIICKFAAPIRSRGWRRSTSARTV